MKILFVTPRFAPEIGGVERHVGFVAQELVKCGNDLEILTSTKRLNLPVCQEEIKLVVHRLLLTTNGSSLDNFRNMFNVWWRLLKNPRLILNKDVIHLHDYQTFLWLLPFMLFIRKKVFITFHGFESFPISPYPKIIRKIAEETVNGNVCIGAFISKWYGTQSQYTTIGGVDAHVGAIPEPSWGGGVFIGRLAKDTNILDIVKAINILKTRHNIDMPLHICGDGPLKAQIKEFANINKLNFVFHGFVDNPQDYLLKCRYAFVSGYLAILEAMVHKRLVFSIYRNSLKKDYLYSIPNVENILFISSSPDNLAEQLSAAIKNPEQTAAIVENAYQFAKQQTWNKIACAYLGLYQKGMDKSLKYL